MNCARTLCTFEAGTRPQNNAINLSPSHQNRAAFWTEFRLTNLEGIGSQTPNSKASRPYESSRHTWPTQLQASTWQYWRRRISQDFCQRSTTNMIPGVFAMPKREIIRACGYWVIFGALVQSLFPHPTKTKSVKLMWVFVYAIIHVNGGNGSRNNFSSLQCYPVRKCVLF